MIEAEEYKVPIKANRGWAGLPEASKIMYKGRYFQPDEDYELWLDRVCRAFSDGREHRGRMKQYIRNYWFHPATPVSSNAGLPEQGLPVSCFVQEVGDSKDGIFNAWEEAFYLGSRGSGTGSYWGNVRESGALINGKGKSSGVVPFLKVAESMTLAVSQGNLRRASQAAYLPINHPEIEEFIVIKDPSGDPARRTPQLFTAVVIDDKFMEAVENREIYPLISPKTGEVVKDVDAFDLFHLLLEQRMTKGVPYILFKDTANNMRPIEYVKEGFDIKLSNLCVAPETKILTDNGYKPIYELEKQKVNIWNGSEWSEVEVFKTGENQKLIKVVTTGGVIDCTPYHKFYIREGNNRNGKTIEKRAWELNVGDKLIKFDLPVINGYKELELAYENGFFSGDGCQINKTTKGIYLYHEKRNLLSKFNDYRNLYTDDSNKRITLIYNNKKLKAKFFVPDSSYTFQSRLNWLAGLLDSDGTLTKNGETQSFQIGSVNYDFLHETLMMLQTLGVTAKLTKNNDAGYRPMPKNNGTGALKDYCQASYRLLIGEGGVQKLLNLGLKTHRLQPKLRQPNRNAEQFIKVTAVIDENRIDDTYCFTEPKKHLGMFNGLCTGQCLEIQLHTRPDYSNICVLSSINVEYFDEFRENEELFKQFIEDIHRFLDNVLQSFIDNAKDKKGFENSVKAAEYERSIGIGVMGLHYYLQKRNIPFESLAAKGLNTLIFKQISEELEVSNKKLAEEKGANPLSAKYNIMRRNTHTMAVAPTASISTLCNQTSSGIEPLVNNIFPHKTNQGTFTVKNRYLKKLLQEKGKDTDKVWSSILGNGGSVSHLDFLTEDEKLVFKTAFEINQQVIIDFASDRQKYIDQAQSLNLFIKPNVDYEYLYNLHMEAWVKNLKGLYYIRSDAPKKVGRLEFKSANDFVEQMEELEKDQPKYDECIWCG